MGSSTIGSSTRTLAGRYRLGTTIGTGPTAKAFDAVDLTDDTPVVVKMLPAAFGSSETFMQRFLVDVGAAADLSHPNIARIRDFGTERVNDRAYPFVVTEQLTGGSLRGMIDRGRQLTASQALVVGLDVCKGLDYAHRRGLIHGAVTPGNLLFGLDRRVRIADFGLSRLLGEITWSHPDRIDIDTARYASPEQAQGMDAGPPTDVYTLCLTLIEAVTGQVPFAADTSVATLAARVDKLMPVSADLGSLAAVLERAGRPEPEDRTTAAELGKALVQAAQSMPRPTPIELVGIGLFGDATGSLPLMTDAFSEPPPAPDRPRDPTPDTPRDAMRDTTRDATRDAPREVGVQARVLEPNVPPPLEPPSDDPVPQAAVRLVPRPLVPIDTSPVLPEADFDDFVQDLPPPVPLLDPGLFIIPAVDPVGGEPADDSKPIPIPVIIPATEPPKRHTAIVETVEGDDDAPDIDRRSMFVYALVAVCVALAALVGVIGYRALSTPSYSVPNLIGVSEAEAGNEVAANGWNVQVLHQRDDTQDQGDVIRTEPSAGEKLKKGATFTMYVSDGPTLAVLPEIAGLPIDQARTMLEDAGLLIREAQRVHDESISPGTVMVWSVPAQAGLVAGSEVPKGTTVEVVVSDGPAPRQVPNLVGLTLVEARERLDAGGLALGSVTEQIDGAVPAGQIISSDPGSGSSLERGGVVAVVVSKGPDVVGVPDLIGKTMAEMEQLLTDSGLVVGSVSGPADGVVRGQNPTAGSLVARGTRVHVIFGT